MSSLIKRLFGSKPTPGSHFVTARLNSRVQPIDRGDIFEDPLNDILTEGKLGQVDGGGTALSEDKESIAFCDIVIELNNISDETIARVCAKLDQLGAAKGSELQFDDGRPPIPFGVLEGMAIVLNGTDLPEEVYQQSDVNATIEELHRALNGKGVMLGNWKGQRGTSLYFYGKSYLEMSASVIDVLKNDPLCAQCRVEQIA